MPSACRRKTRRSRTTPTRASDQQKHCGISARAAALWIQLRLAAGDFYLRAGVLPLETVGFSAHAGTPAGVPGKEPGGLGPEMVHRAGKRASGEWRVVLGGPKDPGGVWRDCGDGTGGRG